MFLKIAVELTGKQPGNRFIMLFFAVSLPVIASFAYFTISFASLGVIDSLKYFYIIFNTIINLVASILLFSGTGKNSISVKSRMRICPSLLFIAFFQSGLLYFYEQNDYIAFAFIFVFFAGSAFLPVYLGYFTDLSRFKKSVEQPSSFIAFCAKYGISKRESEVITEISKGLTNKDIAEKLFISLQTVKDHTHRIYLKTGVRNRTELANLVKHTWAT
jgi:DNA-binding CsgD family transcriptional regulator